MLVATPPAQLLLLHLSTHPLNIFRLLVEFFFFFLPACCFCCPFGHVFFSQQTLIFCHAFPADSHSNPSLGLSLMSVLVRPGRVFMLADSCRHCVKCVWQMRGSSAPSPPLPLSRRNVLASFEIYVALVSWFIFWLPLFHQHDH